MSDTERAGVIHVAGMSMTFGYGGDVGNVRRQRCAWCGALMSEDALDRMAVAIPDPKPEGWKPEPYPELKAGALYEVVGDLRNEPGEALGFHGLAMVEPGEDGKVPPGTCFDLDLEVTR